MGYASLSDDASLAFLFLRMFLRNDPTYFIVASNAIHHWFDRQDQLAGERVTIYGENALVILVRFFYDLQYASIPPTTNISVA
jgi:hypothetical protein